MVGSIPTSGTWKYIQTKNAKNIGEIEECIATPWENGSDYNQEANWFRQGLTYAMMIIRWNYDGETDHK